MALAEGQFQLGDLVMGAGTDYTVLDDFNPWTREVRADQGAARAWGDGSWSGAEWAAEAALPMRIRVRNQADGSPAGWLAAHQRLVAAFAPSHDDVELRWLSGGVEYLMRGRPRVVDPEVKTIRRGYSITRCAFVALDPTIYGGAEHSMTLGLPSTVGGLTVPAAWTIRNANPYFETDASGWSTNAGEGSIVRSTAQAHEGVASGLLTPDGVGTQAAARGDAATGVSPGQVWRGQAWMRCAVARSVTLRIDWRNSSGTFLSSSTVAISVAANTFTYFDLVATAPALAAQAGITALMTGTPPASNTLHIDEATISEMAGGLTLPATVAAAVTSGRATVTNAGTKPTGLRVRIDGPVVEPRISLLTDAGTGIVRVWATLTAGQWLDIDTAARTVYLNGTASRRGVTTADGIGWPVLPAGTHELAFDASAYDPAATATVTWRDTWH